jgi:hypothetical protein
VGDERHRENNDLRKDLVCVTMWVIFIHYAAGLSKIELYCNVAMRFSEFNFDMKSYLGVTFSQKQ